MEFIKLRDELEQLYLLHNKQRMLLVVDSLQALKTDFSELRLSIDEWLINLDSLKLHYDTDLVILLTVEKKRGTYDVASKESAKESGRIEYKVGQLLDIREEEEALVLECTKNRYGPLGEPVRLEKVFARRSDPHSFTFTLKEREAMSL